MTVVEGLLWIFAVGSTLALVIGFVWWMSGHPAPLWVLRLHYRIGWWFDRTPGPRYPPPTKHDRNPRSFTIR